jgi:uncharacterized heparinase superfamily protein
VPLGLLPDLTQAGLRRALKPARIWWRRSWLYRRSLRGPLADHIAFSPHDATARRLEDADALLKGRFRFHGQMVEAGQGSIFDAPPPSPAWAEALHGFAWLPPLALAGGEPARALATALIAEWVARHHRYGEPAWAPEVVARRLMALFSHGRLVIVNSDMLWRSKLFVSLREQSRILERIGGEAPDGVARLETAAALALSGICLDDCPARLEAGLKRLEGEIERQILPDGGHVSRSPQALLDAYRLVMMVMDALTALHIEPPHPLLNARDRMAPMLRFFRHGDGGLALFQGGQECDPRTISGLLARDPVRGQPFQHARYSGYQRLAAGRTILQLDCGKVPDGEFARMAHAGFLAFELSTGPYRIIVNCGAGGLSHPDWNEPLRATAAHSTVSLDEAWSAALLPPGPARDLLGPRLLAGPLHPSTRRSETGLGWMVEASHDGYAPSFGFTHERKLTLSPQGQILTGADRLVPAPGRAKAVAFALRFHIHPEVRVSRLEGGGILLKLPNGEGWRFRHGGGALSIADSIYLGGAAIRRSEQLVISGTALADKPTEMAWVFEQISG